MIQQIASSLGKLIDVDWYSLFTNHFEMVRIKLKCKDPKKIPAQRVLEMADSLYIINYTVADLEQLQGKSENGEDGDNPDDEDDLLGDDMGDIPERDQTDPHQPPPKQDDKKGSNGESTSGTKTQGKAPVQAAHSIGKAFASIMGKVDSMGEDTLNTSNHCINLLRSMELGEESEEDMDYEAVEDDGENELFNLPVEWRYSVEGNISHAAIRIPEAEPEVVQTQEVHTSQESRIGENEPQDTQSEEGKKMSKKKSEAAKSKWGPQIPERKSNRTINDGRTMEQKAQALKRKANLEDPKGKQSYAAVTMSKNDISRVAKIVILSFTDPNVSEVSTNNIISADKLRCESFAASCNLGSCSVSGDKSSSSQSLVDSQEVDPATPKTNLIVPPSRTPFGGPGEDKKLEWTTVAPRRKPKKKIK